LNIPSTSVRAPEDVPLTDTEAPISGSPDEPSTSLPEIDWATIAVEHNKLKNSKRFLIIG